MNISSNYNLISGSPSLVRTDKLTFVESDFSKAKSPSFKSSSSSTPFHSRTSSQGNSVAFKLGGKTPLTKDQSPPPLFENLQREIKQLVARPMKHDEKFKKLQKRLNIKTSEPATSDFANKENLKPDDNRSAKTVRESTNCSKKKCFQSVNSKVLKPCMSPRKSPEPVTSKPEPRIIKAIEEGKGKKKAQSTEVIKTSPRGEKPTLSSNSPIIPPQSVDSKEKRERFIEQPMSVNIGSPCLYVPSEEELISLAKELANSEGEKELIEKLRSNPAIFNTLKVLKKIELQLAEISSKKRKYLKQLLDSKGPDSHREELIMLPQRKGNDDHLLIFTTDKKRGAFEGNLFKNFEETKYKNRVLLQMKPGDKSESNIDVGTSNRGSFLNNTTLNETHTRAALVTSPPLRTIGETGGIPQQGLDRQGEAKTRENTEVSLNKMIVNLDLSNREKETEIIDLKMKVNDLQSEINKIKYRTSRRNLSLTQSPKYEGTPTENNSELENQRKVRDSQLFIQSRSSQSSLINQVRTSAALHQNNNKMNVLDHSYRQAAEANAMEVKQSDENILIRSRNFEKNLSGLFGMNTSRFLLNDSKPSLKGVSAVHPLFLNQSQEVNNGKYAQMPNEGARLKFEDSKRRPSGNSSGYLLEHGKSQLRSNFTFDESNIFCEEDLEEYTLLGDTDMYKLLMKKPGDIKS